MTIVGMDEAAVQRRFDLRLRSLGNKLVFLAEMHEERHMELAGFAQILLSVPAVVPVRL
jgi:hypothetical protein